MTWDEVRGRLERLRDQHANGATGRIFGAGSHQFQALPPLTGLELAEAEAQFGVRLPETYRDFLITVSAGGAGPYYGLFPLVRGAAGRWAWQGDGAELTTTDALATDFDPGDVRAALALLEADEPSEDDRETDEGEEAYGEWAVRRDAVLWAEARTHGAVCLSHEGCAYRDWLVVSGPLRGQMWEDKRTDEADLAPLLQPDGSPTTFDRWYLGWLEQAERDVFGP